MAIVFYIRFMMNRNTILRPLQPGDLELLLLIEQNPENQRYTTQEHPSESELKDFLHSNHDYFIHRQYRYVIDVDGAGVGFIDLSDASTDFKTANTGILILPDWRHKGIALEAMQMLVDHAATLQIEQLYAYIKPDNLASIKLYEQAGFLLWETLDEFQLYSLMIQSK